MSSKKPDLLQGTLDLLVLKTLAQGPHHGYGIAQQILLSSRQIIDVQQGSLYPALHRLQAKGHVDGEWRKTEGGKRAKYYEITNRGRRAVAEELGGWVDSIRAILAVLEVRSEELA